MHALYQLKDMLCEELEEIASKGELTAGTLDTVDKLAHATKNLCKIIDWCDEEEYSSRYDDGMSMARGGNRGGNRGGRRGGRRGANQYGSYGYSRTGDLADKMEDLMREMPDEASRQELQRMATKMRNM